MSSYAVPMRFYLGNITALALVDGEVVVTGGAELLGIRGQACETRWGLVIEVEKADNYYDTVAVTDTERYPRVLIPFSGARREDLAIVRQPLADADFKYRRRNISGLIHLPATGLLIVPDDPDLDEFVYMPAAKLGPLSSDLLVHHEIDPVTIDHVEYVPSRPTQGDDDMVGGTLAEVAAAIEAATGGEA